MYQTVQHSANFLVISYSCLFSWSFCPWSDSAWLDWMVIGAILLIGSVVFISMGVLVSLPTQCSTDDGCWKYCLYCFGCSRWTVVPLGFLPRMAPIYWKADSNLSTDAGRLYLFGTPMNLIFFLPWLC